MSWLYTLWYGYGWPSLKGNGPEALVQTVVYAAIAVAIWPPTQKAIERFAQRHVESLKVHVTAEHQRIHDRLDHHEALVQHVVKHSIGVPPFEQKEET